MDDKEDRELITGLLGKVASGEVSVEIAASFLRLEKAVTNEAKKAGRPNKTDRWRIWASYYMLVNSPGVDTSKRGWKGDIKRLLGKLYNLSRVDNELVGFDSSLGFLCIDCEWDQAFRLLPEITTAYKSGELPSFPIAEVSKELGIRLPEEINFQFLVLLYNNDLQVLKTRAGIIRI